jgi:hypothetical protein
MPAGGRRREEVPSVLDAIYYILYITLRVALWGVPLILVKAAGLAPVFPVFVAIVRQFLESARLFGCRAIVISREARRSVRHKVKTSQACEALGSLAVLICIHSSKGANQSSVHLNLKFAISDRLERPSFS